jgi:hypothetical protein
METLCFTAIDMGHNHNHVAALTGRRLLLAVFITVAFVIGEAAAGYGKEHADDRRRVDRDSHEYGN